MRTDSRFAGSRVSARYWEPEGGESLDVLIRGRLGRGVKRAQERARTAAGVLVLVNHGGINHALMAHLTGMSDRQLTHGPLVSGSTLEALRTPGITTHGQLHVFTLPTPGSTYYDLRIVGVDPPFDSGKIVVERG